MGFYGDGDIPELLGDMGVPVVAGAATDLGIVDRAGAAVFSGDMPPPTGVKIVVYLQTTKFPALRPGDPITVDGTDYIARVIEPMGDGAMTAVACGVPA